MTALERPVPAGLELRRHLWIAGRTLLYLGVGIAQGAVAALLVGGGLLVGGALSLVWVGRRPLDAVVALAWRMADGERLQANRLLAAHLVPLARASSPRRGVEEVRDRAFWRMVAMLLLRLPVALLGLATAAAPVLLAVALLTLGLEGLRGDGERVLGPWALGLPVGVALILLAGAAGAVALAALDGLGQLLRSFARALLRSRTPAAGPVREMLAERLGDRSLSIAYWLPDRGIFVDDGGHRVELPEADSRRAWTAVEREGRRVAAIVHDAGLDATPELVQAAASAAALAIDNERLKADLRARVEDLRVSRLRIVQAADEARRRLERDLHDGAQQRLVALALDIRRLRARAGDDTTQAGLDELAAELAAALAELRELARGIHPAILTDRGLAPALEALASRMGFPVDCEVEVGGRLAPPVEAAAYFVVAEGLTNVARYAEVFEATVRVWRRDGEIEVVVADQGVGGARVDAGTGLRGLADRLAALDGRLALESPAGRGTRLVARIPSGEGGPAEEAPR